MSVIDENGDRYSELRQRALDDYPESWIPSNENDVIAGEFLRLDVGGTSYGPAHIAVVRADDGRERAIWLLHTALKSEFHTARPEPGQDLAVAYRGRRTSASGREYHVYRVVVDNGAAPSWDDILNDDDRAELGDLGAALIQEARTSVPDDDNLPF